MAVNIDVVREFFMWCSIINIGLLLISWMFFWTGSGLIYRMHSKWFKLSQEQFYTSCFLVLAFWKISIFLFCIVPYIAMLIVG